MQATRSLRPFSAAIKEKFNKALILIPQGVDTADLFRSQTRKARNKVFTLAETAVLWETLPTGVRDRLFKPEETLEKEREKLKKKNGGKPDSDPNLSDQDTGPLSIPWGDSQRQIEWGFRQYTGIPKETSVKIIANSGINAGEVRESTNTILELLKHANLRKHVEYDACAMIIRRAGNAGIFKEIFEQLHRNAVAVARKQLNGKFYLEALRVQALRTPYLGKNSLEDLMNIHRRAGAGFPRDMCYSYALRRYVDKFGADGSEEAAKAKQLLKECLERVTKIAAVKRPMNRYARTDFVFLSEALYELDDPQFSEFSRTITSLMARYDKGRPLQIHYEVNLDGIENETEPLDWSPNTVSDEPASNEPASDKPVSDKPVSA